ncbi:MAG: carboxypeptidase-like regulatory domain-containing protein [Bacteroidales bacterium]|jgi:hypothetical protein|nr:carboxypeptidase-like regulatory domain-containing protein [Bacteroidales bacterium]
MKFFIILFLLSSNVLLFGQSISGTVFETTSEMPVEFVNIGIVGKNIGTVSDQNGKYSLQINPEYYNDTLRFSCIGFHSYSVRVSDFISLNNGNVSLKEKFHELTEVVVRPQKIKQMTFGITTRKKTVQACYQDSIRGGEIGTLMKNKNIAFLKEVNVNILKCSYDTIFYRMNIYKADKNMQLENILSEPIYISSSKEEVIDKITVDLRQLNLVIEDDFLVTFESVKDLGYGDLCFPASLLHKSYIRETSQGTWETIPAGISISVEADVKK